MKSSSARKGVRFFLFILGIPLFCFLSYKTIRFLTPVIQSLHIFQYKNAVMTTTEHISEEELKGLIGKVSGNLFDLDLNAVQRNIKKNPWVLEAKVSRIFPERIHVEIAEKKAVALLSGEPLYFLDEFGKKIAPLRPHDKHPFAVISGLTDTQAEKGDLILKAFDLMKLYESKPYFKNLPISEVVYKEGIGYLIFTRRPVFEIRIGDDYWDEKMVRLEKILQDLSQKGLLPMLIDLNFSKKVVVKLHK